MRRLTFISIIALSLFTFGAYSQLVVNPTITPNNLVHNVLIGNGVSASNVTYTGDLVAKASFAGGTTTNLGLGSGILLTSGDASLAPGPSSGGSTGYDNTGTSDPQLAALVTTALHDAAVLEFDFVPLSDTLRFRYVFGSDEYPEFSNSNYNDVFGFFITGPNPNGPAYLNKNIAILPGTTNTPVSINNINNGTANAGPCTNCAFYIDNANGLLLEYDAITTVLTATVIVVPCQLYHFKIAIADAGDGAYDSGVFLEANSFSTDAVQINTNFSVPTAIKMGIEGCNYMEMEASLHKQQTTDYVVHIDTMWGTATNGVDFPLVPDSILIPAGTLTGTLNISPYADGLPEPIETFHVIVETSVCTVDTIVFPILDYSPIVISSMVDDTTICSDSAFLWANPDQGHPPYIVDWTPPMTLSNPSALSLIAKPSVKTTYALSVMDSTGCPAAIDSVTVSVFPKPSVSFNGNPFSGCEPLTVNFQDMSTPNITAWLWDFGDGQTSNLEDPLHVYTAGDYDITLQVTTQDGCSGIFTVPNLIHSYPKPTAAFTADPDVVTVDDPSIDFIDKSTGASNWYWDFGNGSTSIIQNPTHTFNPESGEFNVYLVVTSDKGCSDSVFHTVRVVVDEITVYNIITPNADGKNDVFFIKNIEMVEYSHLRIYNRWGKKVFDQENYQNDWDGDGASDGVYHYTLEYRTYFREDSMQGTITIIRQ